MQHVLAKSRRIAERVSAAVARVRTVVDVCPQMRLEVAGLTELPAADRARVPTIASVRRHQMTAQTSRMRENPVTESAAQLAPGAGGTAVYGADVPGQLGWRVAEHAAGTALRAVLAHVQAHVRAHLRLGRKASPALVTRELHRRAAGAGVGHGRVVAQARRVREPLRTVATRVRAVVAVRALVRLEVIDMREPATTRVAHQRLLAAMYRQVLVTRAAQCKPLPAHAARIRSHAGVVLLMLFQLTMVTKTAIAHLARKQYNRITGLAAWHNWFCIRHKKQRAPLSNRQDRHTIKIQDAPKQPKDQSRILSRWGPSLPNTVAQLPDYLHTQSYHHRHVSIPVLPQAGKSRLVFCETSLEPWTLWISGRISCVD